MECARAYLYSYIDIHGGGGFCDRRYLGELVAGRRVCIERLLACCICKETALGNGF